MTEARPNRKTALGLSGFTILGSIYALVSGALALGPDAWMEWLLWGTTMISLPSARILIATTAAIVVLVLVWPLLNRSEPPDLS